MEIYFEKNKKLHNCYFCGSTNTGLFMLYDNTKRKRIEILNDFKDRESEKIYGVMCEECERKTLPWYTKEEAIRKWNDLSILMIEKVISTIK